MSKTDAQRVSNDRRSGLLEATDQLLPLVWLAFYVLLPPSGRVAGAFAGWFDQRRSLETLLSVLNEGHAEAIDDNEIGPAYIAAAALIQRVSRLAPDDSLVALNEISYALSVAAGMVLVRVLVRRLAPVRSAASLSAQLGFLAIAFGAWTWRWADLPWSHFFAAFLGVAFYTLRLAPARFSTASAVMSGVVLALLALTRSFEFVAVLIAWGLAFAVGVAFWKSGSLRPRVAHFAAEAGGFVVTALAVHLATGKQSLFFLYSSSQGRERVDAVPEEIAETPVFSVALVPVKLVQLFIDPCFYSDCVVNDYSGGATSIEGLWRMPLSVQQPGLVLLPLCLLAVSAVLVWCIRRREVVASRARELRLLLEMTLAAAGITFGYIASTLASSSHLKYGFAREFLLPAALASIVGVSLAVTGLQLLLRRSRQHGPKLARPRVSLLWTGVFVTVVGVIPFVFGTAAARTYGLPRLESRHLGQVAYVADCRGKTCSIVIRAVTSAGMRLSIPQASTLTFGCGDNTPRFSLYVRNPSTGVRVGQTCRDPRLVAAWPLVMGLPPTRPEHYAVKVANATDSGRG